MKDYRDKAKSMQGDKLGRYGAPAKREWGGRLKEYVQGIAENGMPTALSVAAKELRRPPARAEQAIKDVAVDGMSGAGGGHLGRAGRFGRGMSTDGQEDRARGGRIGKGK